MPVTTSKDFNVEVLFMKKLFIMLLVLSGLNVSGQTVTRIFIKNLYDSSAIGMAKVEVNFITQPLRKIKGETDTNGTINLNLVSAEPFYLAIAKDGFKPIFYKLNQAPSELTVYLKPLVYDGEEVMVSATRAGQSSLATYSQFSKKELGLRNFGQDIPVLLQFMPSAVSSSDAGAGIGYTGIRIRGIDPSRINVTVNGVPLNDAESQSVFWVNMPDFASGVENIQVQRGVGTSSNGAGAFGASIHIKTDKYSEKPFSQISTTVGSYNTNKQSIKLGTGRMQNNWYAEGRMSWIHSDGFIDRAASNLQAWYFSTGHKTAKSLFQVNVFSGHEKTYQAWNGVPMVKYNDDTTGVNSLIDLLWYDSSKAQQLRTADPSKYNYYTYKNETDNYKQSHIQLVFNRSLRKNSIVNLVVHGTLGKGYYENFESKTNLINYMDTPVVRYGLSHFQSDLIRQRWLDNQFAGAILSYMTHKARLDQTFGAAFNVYKGKHFGKVVWYEFMNAQSGPFNYYNNHSRKTDASAFWKIQYKISKTISAFADLQLRHIDYSWFGPSVSGIAQGVPSQHIQSYLFFNPKAGMQYQPRSNQLIYLTYGRASREPVRDDFINASPQSIPKPEFLNNVEAAFKSSHGDLNFTFTGFYMGYKNQLALSGKINDVGGYSRINIPKSYRAGIEAEGVCKISAWIQWGINLTLSLNKINKFTEYVDDWSNGGQLAKEWKKTDLALSPNKILGSNFSIKPTENLSIHMLSKGVGRQYLDNTQTQSRSLDPYLIHDIIVNYQVRSKYFRMCSVAFMINNLSNQKYASNGYTFSGIVSDERRDFNFVYPQAGLNYLAKVELLF